jgi:hypothetical protein
MANRPVGGKNFFGPDWIRHRKAWVPKRLESGFDKDNGERRQAGCLPYYMDGSPRLQAL